MPIKTRCYLLIYVARHKNILFRLSWHFLHVCFGCFHFQATQYKVVSHKISIIRQANDKSLINLHSKYIAAFCLLSLFGLFYGIFHIFCVLLPVDYMALFFTELVASSIWKKTTIDFTLFLLLLGENVENRCEEGCSKGWDI